MPARIDLSSVPTKEPSVEETAVVSLINLQDFHTVRFYLERFEDLAILADVVGVATSSLDSGVLASATDTMHYHLKAFRAIGAFDFLFGRVVTRYAAIRTIRFPERELLLSLTGLVRTVHVDGQLLQLLNYDLSRLDQRNSIAACSPASDNMGEISQNTASHSDDEIERILSSGNSMDQQVMARVLRKITCNLKEHVGSSQLHSDSYSVWFHRLRSFDESTFDAVLNEWLTSCLSTHQVEASRIVLPHLVASGCIALTGFLDLLQAHVSKSKTGQPELTFQTAVKGLESLLPTRDLVSWCSPQDAYRYRLDQYKLCFETDARILRFVCEVVELAQSSPSQQLQAKLSHLLAGEPVLSILKHCILVSPGCLSKLRPANLSRRTVDQFLQSSLSTLLDPFGHLCKCDCIQYDILWLT
jgi:mediator of RNA polymerase II transcription subunit 12